MASWVRRMIGAARLDAATYEEVKTDPKATVQAIGVVLLAVVAIGIGGVGYHGSLLIQSLIFFFVGWVLWVFLTWLIGTKFFAEAETRADVGQLVRAIGFSASPEIIGALGWIPLLGPVIKNVVWVWTFAASVVAMRQVLNYKSTGRAILVCGIGWAVIFFLYFCYMAVVMLHGGI